MSEPSSGWDPSQGAPEDRPHIQVFPWNPPQGTDYKRHKSLPLMPLEHKHQETDYKRANKSSPGASFSTPGDRLATQTQQDNAKSILPQAGNK